MNLANKLKSVHHIFSLVYITPSIAANPKSGSSVSVKASTAVLTGLPDGVTKKQIYKRCRKVGEVVNVTYPVEGRDSDTALVQYSNHQVTTSAISALNGKTFKGEMSVGNLNQSYCSPHKLTLVLYSFLYHCRCHFLYFLHVQVVPYLLCCIYKRARRFLRRHYRGLG